MESSIDSPITTAVKLLGKWRTDGRQIRRRLLNNWEGWSIDGIDLFESIEVVEECLTVRFQTWSVSLALAKIEEVSITDSRTPDGMSPVSVEAEYISDSSVLIRIKKADDAQGAHSFLSFSALVDENSFAKA